MKITAILMLAACLQVGATGYTQTVSLSVKDAQLETVFQEIRKQTGYNFIFTREVISAAKPVNINVQNASLKDVLELCFRNQPLSYTIEEKFIVIKQKISKSLIEIPDDPTIDIKGRVLNVNGEPIGGATVTVKNTKQATATNERGEFFLPVVDENATLVVSSIGHKTTEVKVQGKSSIEIQLEVTVSSLDETVVIAYGTTTRRLNTGSVGRITAKEIETQPVSNPLAAMQGRVPGLFISQRTGLPGSDFSVLIRGRNSIQQGTAPLFLIDGVPFNDENLAQRRGSLGTSNPFNTINPLDIQSIEVLKDADATAIYGSRGANGVIIITTKKGSVGKLKTELFYNTGWGKVTRVMDMMNTHQYITMRKEAFENDGFNMTTANASDILAWDTTRYNDWQQILTGGASHYNNLNIRMSSGNQQLSFTLGANYNKESTVFPGNNNLQKTGVQLGINQQSLNSKFNSSFSTSFTSEKGNLPNQDLTQFLRLPPNAPNLYDSIGNLNWSENGFFFSNPMGALLQSFNTVSDRLSSSMNISYLLFPGLQFKLSGGYNFIKLDEKALTPIISQMPVSNPTGSATFGTHSVKNLILEPHIAYSLKMSKRSSITYLLGATWQNQEENRFLASGTGYTNDALIASISGAANITNSNAYEEYKYVALFSRFNYNYNNKYILNLTARRDGSSRFGPGKQFANFGAAGLSYIFSQEQWIKENIPFISFGKLRSSVGITGNDQIGNYQYLDSWNTTQYPYQGQPGLRPTRIFNDQYSWEQNRKWEAALEIGLFNNRIYFTTNWFQNRSNNQLISYSLPTQTGFGSVIKNFPAIIDNTGWEVQITTDNISNEHLKWTSNLNITIARNKLVDFPGIKTSSYANNYEIGEPLSIIKGYQFLGIDPITGIYQFADLNNDGVLSSLDYVALGNTDPNWYGGLLNEITYKGFELQCFFQFVKQIGRHSVYNSSGVPGSAKNEPLFVLDRWQKPNDIAKLQRYSTYTAYTPAVIAAGYLPSSSAILTNASFARLKNLSLSYSLSSKIIERWHLQGVKIYLQAQNLLTITDYVGADPENQSLISLPPLRMITAGIHLIF